MSDRGRDRRPPADAALEGELRTLGVDLAFPLTPDLVATVRAALSAERAPGGRAWTRSGIAAAPRRAPFRRHRVARTLLLAAALVLVAAASVAAAFVVLRGLAIIRVDAVPSAVPTAPIPGPPGSGLDLGVAVDLATAAARTGFPPLVPAATLPDGTALGRPDATWVSTAAGTPRVTLVWSARDGLPEAPETGVGLLVDELRGTTSEVLVTKLVGPDTDVERIVLVDGTAAYWISGGPHTVLYEAPGGDIREAPGRLAAATLVFNRDGLLVRIETAAGQAVALAVADALR